MGGVARAAQEIAETSLAIVSGAKMASSDLIGFFPLGSRNKFSPFHTGNTEVGATFGPHSALHTRTADDTIAISQQNTRYAVLCT